MKKLFLVLSAVIVSLMTIIIIETIMFSSLQHTAGAVSLPELNKESVTNLSKAIAFPTVSLDVNAPVDTNAFKGLQQFVFEAYPAIHSRLKKETISGLSLLYTWQGKNKALKPVILMAHMNVVNAGEADLWSRPPFSGENDGTYIWGRGTLDNKAEMIMILEAVEQLLIENYQPERTLYIAFGHDEEISGSKGAALIASMLKERGVEAEYILDKGSAVTIGMVPMISKPVALVGTSEKGYLSVNMAVEIPGGHSAYPEKETAITVMSKAVYDITNHQMESQISKPVDDFIRYVGPEMPFYSRALFANRWLFDPVILEIYEGGTSSNALVRTTTAPTIIRTGFQENVIPSKAEAVINFRILPGQTTANVIEHLKKVINDDRVKITILKGNNEPRPVSPINSFGFNTIFHTISQIYPEAIVAPTMLVVGTDSREYKEISEHIYNFAPILVDSKDLARIHGLDERIKIEDFTRGILFYYQLIKNSNS